MLYPTTEEFKSLLLRESLETIVKTHVFSGVPYVFRDNPHLLDILRNHLSKLMPIDKMNIIVVGSARTGFSLSPDAFPRAFSTTSDIDVLIVDTALFDTMWKTMLKWHYPRRTSGLARTDSSWAKARRKELYWGWFVPSKIHFDGLSLPAALQPMRDIATNWFNAFRSLSKYREFSRRNVSGRLYRTWEHALLYHTYGLRQIKGRVEAN